MKRKYRFSVSQQANLLGLEWTKLATFALSRAERFEERKHRVAFLGEHWQRGYHWSYPHDDYPATLGRFLPYFLFEAQFPEETLFEIYLKETDFPTQLEASLAERLGEAEVALVEFLGMHPDQVRFFARDLGSGKEMLYCPNDYLPWWTPPVRPGKDNCYAQVVRVPLRSVSANADECVLLTPPTYFCGNELRARGLTALRLCPNGLSSQTVEKKLWSHAHWMDFCADMPIPSENYLQALVRWEEYLGVELERSWSFPALLHELEMSPCLIARLTKDLGGGTIAVPELEWVLETLWNEQPRISLWGKTPKQTGRFLCNQQMLDRLLAHLGAKSNLLPRHVLLARPL
jgi:hypothetical protein